MLRVREFSKLLTCTTARQYYSKLFNRDLSYHRIRNEYTFIIRTYSDKSKVKDPKKISSLKDCPPPNLMSELPEPTCSWDEQNKAYRSKSKTVLLVGILFAAVSLGTAWFVGIFDTERKPQKVVVKKDDNKKTKLPSQSKDIPKNVPYLLIGGGTASFTAFRAIKSADPTAKVLVITNEKYFPYMRPPLSKEIWFNDDQESVQKLIFKQWNGSERSLFYEPDDFYTDCKELMRQENGGVAVARGWTVSDIDVVEKQVTLDDGYTIHYDKCLIATGASPRFSPVFQVALEDPKIAERVRGFRNIFDFLDVNNLFEKARNIAIIGGGFLGSELGCAMARKDKKKTKHIYQIFPEKGNMGKILPEYLSLWTSDKVRAEGVDIISEAEVVGVKSDGKGLQLTLDSGKVVNVDYALVAVGAEPNTELATNSGLEIDPEFGGYLVNTELQARSDLYIAGDCACFYDVKLGRRRVEHHDHAVVTGRLAGENMTGARKPYLHQSMFWSDLGPDVGYEAIGIVDSSLPTVAVFAKATEKDSPKAVVTATGEGIRSNTEENPVQLKISNLENNDPSCPNKEAGEDFGKGIIFYLRDDIVVGIVLWNVFNRMSIARQVLKDQKKYDDLNEVAKLFNIHDE